MINWISYPVTLTGQTVDLISMRKNHFTDLETLAHDKRIWEFYPCDGSDPDTFFHVFSSLIIERRKGNQFPFVIFQ